MRAHSGSGPASSEVGPVDAPAVGHSAGVVVPAHNEADVIGATLQALLASATPDEFDIVVVANACSDATAEVARAQGVRVIETAVPGKANALRLGDAAVTDFPRIYLDADVRLSTSAARRMVEVLRSSATLACAPVPTWDTVGVNPMAARVHRVHEALVGPRRALSGAGVYALSRGGHARVFPIPDVISDDGWVHRQFVPEERAVVPDAHSVVRPAPSLSANLKRRTRLRRGNEQLAGLGLPAPEGTLRLRDLGRAAADRSVGILDVAVYAAMVTVDRVVTTRAGRDTVHWSTDRRP